MTIYKNYYKDYKDYTEEENYKYGIRKNVSRSKRIK